MNVMEIEFRQGEESWLSEEKEVLLICDRCDKELREGDRYHDNNIMILCEECARERFEEELQEV